MSTCDKKPPMPVTHEVIVVYFVLVIWESFSTPVVSHSDSWQGSSFTLIGLLAGAFWIGPRFRPLSWAFVYGLGGSFLFVYRFFSMDRFGLWLIYRAPSTTVITLLWILFAVVLGVLSLIAAFIGKRTSKDEVG